MTFLEVIDSLFNLFITFFTTGLFTIGGGQAMIGMLENELVNIQGWISFETFQNFVTISESTPGPIVINMATFIGQELFANVEFAHPILNFIMPVVGSLTATLAVVLPSFVIILIIAKIMDKFIKNKYVKFALKGIRPFIIAIIIVAAGKFFYNSLNIGEVSEVFNSLLLNITFKELSSFISINKTLNLLEIESILRASAAVCMFSIFLIKSCFAAVILVSMFVSCFEKSAFFCKKVLHFLKMGSIMSII